MPIREVNLWGGKLNFNPGPFNFKEHELIILMANASCGSGAGYLTDILTAQVAFLRLRLRLAVRHPPGPAESGHWLRSSRHCPGLAGHARQHDLAPGSREYGLHVQAA